MGSRFSDGALVPRYDVVCVQAELAYTVGVEEGIVRIDREPASPMLLRVTHIWRHDDIWRLVHRHADFPPPDQRQRPES